MPGRRPFLDRWLWGMNTPILYTSQLNTLRSVDRLLRSAKWRQGPASDSQKAWVRKRSVKRDATLQSLQESVEGSSAKPEDRFAKMTKGEAANLITRLKHGAQVSIRNKPF